MTDPRFEEYLELWNAEAETKLQIDRMCKMLLEEQEHVVTDDQRKFMVTVAEAVNELTNSVSVLNKKMLNISSKMTSAEIDEMAKYIHKVLKEEGHE